MGMYDSFAFLHLRDPASLLAKAGTGGHSMSLTRG